jgi:endonuclease/exonuclease/phosphatase family metal-dependent hydrolase
MIVVLSSLFGISIAQDASSQSQAQRVPKLTQNSSPQEIRVLSYNIHHGAGIDGKLDLERIAKVILSERPDLVALQEVDVNVKRSNSIDQARTLAELCEMKFAFGGNIKLQGGEYGNAVLSKFKIVKFKNTKLPNFDSGEQRGILNCTIKIAGLAHDIEFSSTHFDHRRNDEERFASSQSVNRQLENTIAPISILAGDFNDVLFGRTIIELEKSWVRSNDTMLPTIPVKKPNRQIDFIFASKTSKLTCIKTKVLSEAVASDHRALLAIYQLDSK